MEIKKIMAAILIMTLLLGAVACDSDNGNNNPSLSDLRETFENNTPPPDIPENPVSDFEYKTVDGGVEITNYTGSATEVKIPNIIAGAHVVSISGAFENRSAITAVIIPDTVSIIGWDTFKGCVGLTSIILPTGLTHIGGRAFSNTGLTSIIFPDGLTRIGEKAFQGTKLTGNIIIPDNVTHINWSSFICCDSPGSEPRENESPEEIAERVEYEISIHDERCRDTFLTSATYKGIVYDVERQGVNWNLPYEFYENFNS